MAYPDLAGAVNWSTCNGGSPPAAGDTLYLNSTCVLTLDGADASTYTCVAIKAATSAAPTTYNQNGYIVLGNATSTIAANLFAGTADMISLTSAANKTFTCTGTMTGGSAANVDCMNVASGTHDITVNNLTGGSSVSAAIGLRIDGGTISLTVNGTCQGASYTGLLVTAGTVTYTQAIPACIGSPTAVGAYGADFRVGSPTITVATGGGANEACGVVSKTASTVTVTTAKGGTHIGAFGAAAYLGGTVLVNGTDLTGTGYPASSYGGTLKIAAGVMLAFSNAAGALKKFYGPELLPAKDRVVLGTLYGDSTDSANYGTTEGTAEGNLASVIIDAAGEYTVGWAGILDNAGACTFAPGILDADGVRYAEPGILDSDGARTAAPGILDSAGARTAKPGILDADGARTAAPGVVAASGVRYATGLVDVETDYYPYGVLTGAAVHHATGVLDNHGEDYYTLVATDSPPYLTGEAAGEAAQLATDAAAVNAELGNMTTAVVNLLDAANDGTLSLDDVLSTAGGNYLAPIDGDILDEASGGTAYGAGPAFGSFNLSLYTLTSGIVWPAEANVSDVETAWGPTGAEYAGGLDLDLYQLITDVADFLETNKAEIIVADTAIEAEYGVVGSAAATTEYIRIVSGDTVNIK